MPKLSPLLFCAHCAGEAKLEINSMQFFGHRAACQNPLCGIATPWTRGQMIATTLWNKRVKAKPAKRSS